MSLVADYGSDVPSSDEGTDVQNVETTTITKNPLPSKSKRKGPVKIVVDLPKPNKDDDDDSDKDQSSKKSKPSGSSLFALLPEPKRSVTINKSTSDSFSTKPITASTSFVPHTLTKRKPTVAQKISNSKIKGKEVKVQSDEDEDTIESNKSFFPLGAEITNIIPNKMIEDESFNITNSDKIESYNFESNATAESYNSYNVTNDYYNYNYNYQWDAGTEYYYDESQLQQPNSEHTQPDNQIDEEVIQKLGGRRGKEGPIIIKEINAADQMADARQAQMGELTKPGKTGGGAYLKPTKGQKRKHNLMYLAYQAAAMENDLKEQFAANKKTKRETQAKYGF